MLTPDDESYDMKARRVMNYAFTSAFGSFLCGLTVGMLLWKFHEGILTFFSPLPALRCYSGAYGIALVAISGCGAIANAFRAHRELKKLVAIIP